MAKRKTSISLSKRMAELARKRWKKVPAKDRSAHFSRIAKMSHPKNNPAARREAYNGGRPPAEK